MTFEGFFELNDARDLFKKLERDYHRLQENPLDQDAAFDFFVTAYHMLEWAYPGHSAKRSAMEKDTVLLKIASHLANGAKHFRLTHPKHKSISGLEKQDVHFEISKAILLKGLRPALSPGPPLVRSPRQARKTCQ